MALYGTSKYGTAKYGVSGGGGGGSPGISGPFDPIYELRIADLTGTVLETVPHNNLQYGFKLNEPPNLTWVIPERHPKCVKSLLDPGKREVHLYRNGVRVWGGYLWQAMSSDNDNVRFGASGYASRLPKWAIDVDRPYTNADEIDIAWDLISWYQSKANANMGFARGDADVSGFNRTIKWLSYERVMIMDAINEISTDDDGFDWEIDQFKKFNAYYKTQGSLRTDIVFELGKNVVGISIDIDGTQLANNWTALGSGDGASMCVATSADATSQVAYGLLDGVESFSEIRSFNPLQRMADSMLRQYKNPRWQPQLSLQLSSEPLYGVFGLGDTCRTIGHYGYMDVDQNFRIIAIEYQLSNEGREQCSVYLDVTPLP